MKSKTILFGLLSFCVLHSCEYFEDLPIGGGNANGKTIQDLKYIDEYIIPDATVFNGSIVGGLSGIDYKNGNWCFISDDANPPIRFYEADITYNLDGFTNVTINNMVELKDKDGNSFANGTVDPESIRYTKNGNIIWCSEGQINQGIAPFVRFSDTSGNFIDETQLADKYKISTDNSKGPRHNGTFEGLSVAKYKQGYWVAMELPLIQDGEAPKITDTESPVRIAYIDKNGNFGKEFAYELDPVVRQATPTSFTVNGLVEVLEYKKNRFLVLERSFSTGFSDGGNDVKIYEVDASNATDISNIPSLTDATYTTSKKTLLFDLEDIRSLLADGVIDNIEGITFGPVLENGHRSLVLVADNNFSAFGPQLNQFILFEVL
ncbi:esterase-like activity of phytase family protein [Flavobacteriaceae bacterium MHTCC 0001]